MIGDRKALQTNTLRHWPQGAVSVTIEATGVRVDGLLPPGE